MWYESVIYSPNFIRFETSQNLPWSRATPDEIFKTPDELAEYHADVAAMAGAWDKWNQPGVTRNGISREAQFAPAIVKAGNFVTHLAYAAVLTRKREHIARSLARKYPVLANR